MRSPLPAGFVQTLERALGGEHVRVDDAALGAASSDEAAGVEPVRPDVVVWPGSDEDVLAVLRACAEHRVPVTPRGAGTGKAGGCVPVAGGVVLSTERLNEIEEIDEDNHVLVVQPGAILADVQRAAEERGLFYPPDPGALELCTIGGNVATNAGGPRALKYGVTGDFVLGARAALPTGELVTTGGRTVKGVTGYDLTSLLVGSEGTLAVITRVTLRLVAEPAVVQTALVELPSAEHAARVVRDVLRAGVVPRALEIIDRACLAALRAEPDARAPFSADAGAVLLVETDGRSDEEALAQLERVVDVADAGGATTTRVATDARQRRELWTSRRNLSRTVKRLKPRKVAEDVVVPRAQIPALIAALEAFGERHQLLTCAYGHAGDGNLHAQVLFDDDDDLPRVERLLNDLFTETIALGGTLTGEHGVGLAKKRFVPLEQDDATIALQRRIKRAFDPEGILNPGKMLPDKILRRATAAQR
jgi:glycolate oxidase